MLSPLIFLLPSILLRVTPDYASEQARKCEPLNLDRYIVYVVNIIEIDPHRIKYYDEARFDSSSTSRLRTLRLIHVLLVPAPRLTFVESQPTHGRSVAGLKVYATDFDRLGASYSISAVRIFVHIMRCGGKGGCGAKR